MAAPPFVTGAVVTATEMNTLARAYWRKLTEKDVVNTASAVDLLNGEVTIDAGAMGANRMLRATLVGDYLNNTGADRTFVLTVDLGTTLLQKTVGGAGASSISASATRRPFRIEIEICNLGAANSQWSSMSVFLGEASSTGTGLGDLTNVVRPTANGGIHQFALVGANGAHSRDTTSAQTLAVYVTHSTASTSLSARLKYAIVEVV